MGTPGARPALIGAGAVLWVTNVLLFGLWYWQLDRGGPLARAKLAASRVPDFLFPQMTDGRWSRRRLDAGPGRLPVCLVHQRDRVQPHRHDAADPDREVLMAGQALVALVTVGLVVARAVEHPVQ